MTTSTVSSPCRVDPGNFYGCYLLTSLKEKCRNHTYIGFTVDPNRRLRQHNGEITNGAVKTSRKRPWVMVLVVYGFPEEKMALRFEWAWQNPRESRRLKDHPVLTAMPRKTENLLPAKIKVLGCLLNVSPWNRLPLTVHWLKQEYYSPRAYQEHPEHMRLKFGPLPWNPSQAQGPNTDSLESDAMIPDDPTLDCIICMQDIPNDTAVSCLRPHCHMRAHMACLAGWFLRNESEQCIPIKGTCPLCRHTMLWGDVITRYHTLNNNTTRHINPRRHVYQTQTAQTTQTTDPYEPKQILQPTTLTSTLQFAQLHLQPELDLPRHRKAVSKDKDYEVSNSVQSRLERERERKTNRRLPIDEYVDLDSQDDVDVPVREAMPRVAPTHTDTTSLLLSQRQRMTISEVSRNSTSNLPSRSLVIDYQSSQGYRRGCALTKDLRRLSIGIEPVKEMQTISSSSESDDNEYSVPLRDRLLGSRALVNHPISQRIKK